MKRIAGHNVQTGRSGTVPRQKPPGFWERSSTVFILKQVWWQRDESDRAFWERRDAARVGLSMCAAMQLLNCPYGELRQQLGTIPRGERKRPLKPLSVREHLRRSEEQEEALQATAATRLRGLTGVGVQVIGELTEDSLGPVVGNGDGDRAGLRGQLYQDYPGLKKRE